MKPTSMPRSLGRNRGAGRSCELPSHDSVRAQQAVFGLLPHVHVQVDAPAIVHVVGGAILERLVGAPVLGVAAARKERIFGSNLAANTNASVGAGDVVESEAVERADLHVFDGLGFHRKIGGLGPADGSELPPPTPEENSSRLSFQISIRLAA